MNGIRFFRKKNHMTQSELAEAIGVTQTSVSQWESGRNYPDIKTAKRMAEMFGASLDQILGMEEMTEEDLLLSYDMQRHNIEFDGEDAQDAILLEQKARLVKLFRNLSPHARMRVLDRAEAYYEIEQLEKRARADEA
ncbi:MAG: helix-turn-helix transcriptional regulator [Saccharofermentanales bacterium]|jgi:transcriptional regulator with XRE-family HTH domain